MSRIPRARADFRLLTHFARYFRLATPDKKEAVLKVLIVGGTGFLGGAMTDAAVAAGHRVTVLARGRTERAVPASVETFIIDRHGQLAPLAGRVFDLVIDTCAYTPDAVAALLDALGPSIGRYAMVSSISAYAGFSTRGLAEDAPASRATEEQRAVVLALPPAERSSAAGLGAAYGPMKRECEIEAVRRLGDRALILRVGLLVGAGDYTDRFTYWVRRVDQGGMIPCPGDPMRPVQMIEVRDVAEWTITAAEYGIGGIFNITGYPIPMVELLDSCRCLAGSDARFAWIPEDAVLKADLAPWTEVPLWLPSSNGRLRHMLEVSVEKAIGQGLRTRPLIETVEQVLAWDRGRRSEPLKAGMPPAKEAALLAFLDSAT
jgi:2'-hydroxyisoflavone reductase